MLEREPIASLGNDNIPQAEALPSHADTPAEVGSVVVNAEIKSAPTLEQLRGGLRGRDSAVELVGDAEARRTLNDVLVDPGHHTHDELLDAMFTNFSGETYGDEQWVKVIGAWGDAEEVTTAYGKFREEHPEFASLSLDPGFMTHLPEFMDMISKGQVTATDPAGARAQLKEKLGDTTLWRGMTLTEEELAAVREQGILSPLSRVTAESDHPVEQFSATALSVFPSESLDQHFFNQHPQTPFMSVTEQRDIAIAVGNQYGSRESGKRLYLFELKIPTIDVISYTEHALKMPSMLRDLTERNPDAGVRVSIDGGEESFTKWTEGAEHYTFWKIDPQNIVNVTQPAVTESSWNGRVTGKLG